MSAIDDAKRLNSQAAQLTLDGNLIGAMATLTVALDKLIEDVEIGGRK